MRQPLWRVSVVTSVEAEDAVNELLSSALGESCTAYHDFETGRTTVSAFLSERMVFKRGKDRISQGLARIRECGLTKKPPKILCKRVRREDWAESWKRHFKPLQIGRKLLIKPSWSGQKPKAGQAMIILDPGLSFGTGHHPTTAFCLRELARVAPEDKQHPKGWTPNETFLDAGTGSGILAIAAAKLGFPKVDAFDFDAEALDVARRNARRNRVAGDIHFFRQDATQIKVDRGYSVVCANLSTDVLKQAMSRLAACVHSGGRLIVAGILKREFVAIQRIAQQENLRLVRRKDENEWSSGAFLK